VATVIPHGIDLDSYQPRPRHRPSGNYLAVLSRMSPDKGIDVAIKVARRAGRRLKIAAKMREPVEYAYYHDVIEPLLGDGIEYVGEVDHHHKIRLLAGADVLLNPIQWPEPFGLAMIEALACGTPVIATPHGAAPEIVVPEVNGYLATTIDELAYAVGHLDRIDRRRCRYHALNHFSMQAMAAEHAAFYQEVIATRSGLLGGA
jgi:glycosyltransferase involved in cell wall biosynthesis